MPDISVLGIQLKRTVIASDCFIIAFQVMEGNTLCIPGLGKILIDDESLIKVVQ